MLQVGDYVRFKTQEEIEEFESTYGTIRCGFLSHLMAYLHGKKGQIIETIGYIIVVKFEDGLEEGGVI